MSPTLKNKEKVQLVRKRFYFPGDIVAVSMGPSIAVHRFIGYGYKHKVVAFTRTDEGRRPDPAQPFQNILGKAHVNVPLKIRFECIKDWGTRTWRGMMLRC